MINKRTRRLARISILVSMAVLLNLLETIIPIPVPIPGVKLGLANIVTLVAIPLAGPADTITVVILRCLISSLMYGGPYWLVFSLCGGLLSVLVMILAYRFLFNYLSMIGISILGAVTHNIGQILAACILTGDIYIMALLPVLLISAVVTGSLTGLCANLVWNSLRQESIS